MRKLFLSVLLLLPALALPLFAQDTPDLIPQPRKVTMQTGEFRLPSQPRIAFPSSLEPQAKWLAGKVRKSTGFAARLLPGKTKGDIVLLLDTLQTTKAESYVLDIREKGIVITAHDAAGAFYGMQTLLQLFPAPILGNTLTDHTDWKAPCLHIEDSPSHPYRGFMLDVARYFFPKEFVLKTMDCMAAYKLNKLHLHLIDDSGWRLEIPAYPRLTEVGAWAGEGSKRLGGYYTCEDVKEMVEYAAVRGIEVIPEIEFPAHILSAVAAYPHLCCTGKQHQVPTQHFISRDLLCVGRDSALIFLKDVLDATMNMFPSRYIHIGGDEAVYERWEQCPHCQALMKREGLEKVPELQGWLTNKVNNYLVSRGRTAIGWEEALLRGKIDRPLVSMVWHQIGDTIVAQKAGAQALVAPCYYTYLDFPESGKEGEVKAATWCPPIPLSKCYSLPLPDSDPSSCTIGIQACMWSDQFIHGEVLQEIRAIDENRSERYMEYLTFPRLLAVSELGWTTQKLRSFTDFRHRLSAHFARLDAMGCNFRVPEPILTHVPSADGENKDGWTFTLESPVRGARVAYTTNGTDPHARSRTAQPGEKVRVASPELLKAITVFSDTKCSMPTSGADALPK